jgi:hypothetical protein
MALELPFQVREPTMATFVQDDGRFRFSAELFIVSFSAPRGDRHP